MKKIKVFEIWKNPIRDGFAQKIKSNIRTKKELKKLLDILRRENPNHRFWFAVEYKTEKQLRYQEKIARLLKTLKGNKI